MVWYRLISYVLLVRLCCSQWGVARIVRVVRFFNDLRVMVNGIKASSRALLWAVVPCLCWVDFTTSAYVWYYLEGLVIYGNMLLVKSACLLLVHWFSVDELFFLTWTKALLLLVTVYTFRFCRSMLFLPDTALYSLHLGVSHIEHCSLGRAYHPSTKVTYVFGVTFMQLSAAYLTGTSGKDSMLITYYGTWLDSKSQELITYYFLFAYLSRQTPHDMTVGWNIQKKMKKRPTVSDLLGTQTGHLDFTWMLWGYLEQFWHFSWRSQAGFGASLHAIPMCTEKCSSNIIK